MTARVLVAGIGNLFCGDDGFGPEVVRRLAASGTLPAEVRAVDYGIRGMHLPGQGAGRGEPADDLGPEPVVAAEQVADPCHEHARCHWRTVTSGAS